MFRALVDSDGEIDKAEDMDTGKMYTKVAGGWYLAPGVLAGHLRFHPYAEVVEVAEVPGLDVGLATFYFNAGHGGV